jgi:pyrroloquinoline quinone (PQQ) biosynthesis protein C
MLRTLEEAAQQGDACPHPFHERWLAGELDPVHLAAYAAQYRFAVRALAMAGLAAGERDDRADDASLWERFARVCRAPLAPPTYETVECSAAWRAGATPLEHLAVLYTVDKIRSETTQMELAALARYYGISGTAATGYFVRQSTRAAARAAAIGARIACNAREGDLPLLLRRARHAAAGYNRLLDGVDRLCTEKRFFSRHSRHA